MYRKSETRGLYTSNIGLKENEIDIFKRPKFFYFKLKMFKTVCFIMSSILYSIQFLKKKNIKYSWFLCKNKISIKKNNNEGYPIKKIDFFIKSLKFFKIEYS